MTLKITHKFFAAALLSATFLMTGAGLTLSVQAATNTVQSTQKARQGVTLDLKAGQVFQIVLPRRGLSRDAYKARQLYKRQVRPYMSKRGYRYLGELKVDQKIIGDIKPSAAEFFTYESAGLRERLEDNKNWVDLQNYRHEGWKHLDVFSTLLTTDLNIQFDPDKSYTLAVAWTNPAHPEDYDRYLDTVEAEFETVGARFVHKFRDIDYKSRWTDDKIPPAQMILAEWDREDSLGRLLAMDAYKQASPLFRSGLSDFRFYRMSSEVVS